MTDQVSQIVAGRYGAIRDIVSTKAEVIFHDPAKVKCAGPGFVVVRCKVRDSPIKTGKIITMYLCDETLETIAKAHEDLKQKRKECHAKSTEDTGS